MELFETLGNAMKPDNKTEETKLSCKLSFEIGESTSALDKMVKDGWKIQEKSYHNTEFGLKGTDLKTVYLEHFPQPTPPTTEEAKPLTVLESQEFFDLMQQYRIASPTNQDLVIRCYERVKEFLLPRLKEENIYKPTTPTTEEAKGHTPGELFLTDEGTIGQFDIMARPAPMDGGDIICCAPQEWPDSMKRWRANAARIVKAWNEFDQLKQDNLRMRNCLKAIKWAKDNNYKRAVTIEQIIPIVEAGLGILLNTTKP